MDRFALLVDAGYFFAAGSKIAFDDRVQRRDLRLTNPQEALDDLVKRSQQSCGGLPLLRTYWYDAMLGHELSPDQAELALLDSLKLRLGTLNGAGQQKGVDALMVIDLIELARNRAISDAVVLSGDEDVRVGVQVAQSYGLRVHLLAVGDASKNVSRPLRHEVDTLQMLDEAWFERFFEDRTEKGSAEAGPDTMTSSGDPTSQHVPGLSQVSRIHVDLVPGESLRETVVRVTEKLLDDCDQRDLDQLRAQFEMAWSIPSDYDRRLIATVSNARGGTRLSDEECREIRSVFREIVRATS